MTPVSGKTARVKHRRCDLTTAAYTSASGYQPPTCVMCGEPVTGGQGKSQWHLPGHPLANRHGLVLRHPQASSDGVPCLRMDLKWGRSHA